MIPYLQQVFFLFYVCLCSSYDTGLLGNTGVFGVFPCGLPSASHPGRQQSFALCLVASMLRMGARRGEGVLSTTVRTRLWGRSVCVETA